MSSLIKPYVVTRPPTRVRPASTGWPRRAIVDGLNVMHHGQGIPRLEVLLTLAVELVQSRCDLLCISDAHTRSELADAQGEEVAKAYERLLVRFPCQFFQCPSGTEADPYLLTEAAYRNAVVISNDKFEDHLHRFKWLEDSNRVKRVFVVRGGIHFAEQRLKIRENLQELADDLARCLGYI